MHLFFHPWMLIVVAVLILAGFLIHQQRASATSKKETGESLWLAFVKGKAMVRTIMALLLTGAIALIAWSLLRTPHLDWSGVQEGLRASGGFVITALALMFIASFLIERTEYRQALWAVVVILTIVFMASFVQGIHGRADFASPSIDAIGRVVSIYWLWFLIVFFVLALIPVKAKAYHWAVVLVAVFLFFCGWSYLAHKEEAAKAAVAQSYTPPQPVAASLPPDVNIAAPVAYKGEAFSSWAPMPLGGYQSHLAPSPDSGFIRLQCGYGTTPAEADHNYRDWPCNNATFVRVSSLKPYSQWVHIRFTKN